MRHPDFNHMVRLGWVRSPQSIEVRFGTSRAGAVNIALYTTASVDAVPAEHPEADREQLRTVEKGRRSPLAALRPQRRKPPRPVRPPASRTGRKGVARDAGVLACRSRLPGTRLPQGSGTSGPAAVEAQAASRRAAGTDGAGSVAEEPGEAHSMGLVARELLPSAET
ncbi:hypothetical protein [Streptomyces filamentosus]|uniref:hypothetical protein n=1 Tax=Streptomyces filamentosus TaxID=67294 RepID=UPI00332D5AC4